MPTDPADRFAIVPRWLLRATWTRPTDIAVYACLADYADKAGYCWPSTRRIAAEANVCRDTVGNAVRRLETGGAITREIRYGRNTRYRVLRNPFVVVRTPPATIADLAPPSTRGPQLVHNRGTGVTSPPVDGDAVHSSTPRDVERVRKVIADAAASVDPGFAERLAAHRAKSSPPAADVAPHRANAREAAAGGGTP